MVKFTRKENSGEQKLGKGFNEDENARATEEIVSMYFCSLEESLKLKYNATVKLFLLSQCIRTFFIKRFCIIFKCVCVRVYVCACIQRLEAPNLLELWCVLLMGAGKRTQVLWKGRMCSYLMSYLSSPCLCISTILIIVIGLAYNFNSLYFKIATWLKSFWKPAVNIHIFSYLDSSWQKNSSTLLVHYVMEGNLDSWVFVYRPSIVIIHWVYINGYLS